MTSLCDNGSPPSLAVPMSLTRIDNQDPVAALRLLSWLRLIAIVSQIAIIAYVHHLLHVELPLLPLAVTIGALGAWNVVAWRRIRSTRRVSHLEVALHLTVDIAAFTTVIYLTGGPANPFVSLYLVPVSLAAASLPSRLAWLIGALCALAYTLLLYIHVPLPSIHGESGEGFDLHLAGMWVNFLVAAALIVYFVGRMGTLVLERDRELATMREATLRDRQIIEFGTFAAGAAHEVNTPLATLALLVEELDEQCRDTNMRAKLNIMNEQIALISGKLNAIAAGVGADRSRGARSMWLAAFIDELVTGFRRAHPDIAVEVERRGALPETRIIAEATLEQAFRNVLDNAAHAAVESESPLITVVIDFRDGKVELAVIDNGTGLSPSVQGVLGHRIVTTKPDGLGVGVLLSHVALQRFGGSLRLDSSRSGGVEAHISLPLDELVADGH